jgi:hypothetical protein
VSFTIGLLVELVIPLVALVLLVGLAVVLVNISIPMLKGAISDIMTMLTTTVAYFLGC